MTEKVEFWFDPTCPWTWVTAKWMKEVEKVRDIEVKWVPFSLYFLNEGRDLPASYRKLTDANIGGSRVMMATRETAGEEALEKLYFSVATKMHEEKMGLHDALVAGLAENNLDADLIGFAESEDYDSPLRASTQAGLDKVGDEVGVPIVSLNDTAFFGPVLSSIPRGEQAGKIFDGAVAMAEFPGFYELKRSRSGVEIDFS